MWLRLRHVVPPLSFPSAWDRRTPPLSPVLCTTLFSSFPLALWARCPLAPPFGSTVRESCFLFLLPPPVFIPRRSPLPLSTPFFSSSRSASLNKVGFCRAGFFPVLMQGPFISFLVDPAGFLTFPTAWSRWGLLFITVIGSR